MKQNLAKESQVIGFLDEFSPQTIANIQKLWSITKLKANTFDFYAIKGLNKIDFKKRSLKKKITEFLRLIKAINPYN